MGMKISHLRLTEQHGERSDFPRFCFGRDGRVVMQRTANPSTSVRFRLAPPGNKAYRLADGESLYLYVAPSGVRSWQLHYRLDGKQQTATLGKLSTMSLALARTKADQARKDIAEARLS